MNYCVLGTRAGAGPYNSQNPSGMGIICAREVLLFDCGEGCVLQLQRAGVRRSALSAVFISHRHADHCLGLLGLIAAFSSDRRKETLTIVAPPEVHTWLHQSIETLHIELNFEIVQRECPAVVSAEVYHNGDVRVLSAPMDHRVPAFAFRVEETQAARLKFKALKDLGASSKEQITSLRRDGKLELPNGSTILFDDFWFVPHPPLSVVYSGDTAACEALRVISRAADVLVCEATFTEKFAERAELTRHMTARAAAEIAAAAEVGHLVLTHFSTRYRDSSAHLAEALRYFPSVAVAQELQILPVERREN